MLVHWTDLIGRLTEFLLAVTFYILQLLPKSAKIEIKTLCFLADSRSVNPLNVLIEVCIEDKSLQAVAKGIR